jgi:hypothetical protein
MKNKYDKIFIGIGLFILGTSIFGLVSPYLFPEHFKENS